jgi:fatty acid synthase, animal type
LTECFVLKGSGHFEIVEGGITVVDGVIKAAENEKFIKLEIKQKVSTDFLCKDDFYKELSLRGYQYTNEFKGVHEAHANDSHGFGKIEWNSNWVSFTDCMLQIVIVANDSRDLFLPTSIRRMKIHPEMHQEILNKNTDNLLEIIIDPNMKTMQCGGVEISGLDASFVNRRRSPTEPLLENYSHIPHFPTPKFSKFDAAKFCIQLFLENSPSLKVTLIEIDANDDKEPLCEFFNKALEKVPLIVADICYLTKKEVDLKEITVKNETLSAMEKFDIVLKSGAIHDKEFLKTVQEKTDGCGYILSREKEKPEILDLPENARFIACVTVEGEWIFMIQWVKSIVTTSIHNNIINIPTNFEDFKWLQKLKEAMKKGLTVIYAKTDQNLSGILGLFNCLKKEPNVQNLRCFLIVDSTAPDFDLNDPFYKSQFDLGLTVNVYRDRYWGTYRHLTLSQDSETKPQINHCFVNLQNRGDLTSLTWMTGPLDVKSDDVVKVHFAALNFRDVLVATRRITLDYEMENRIKRQYICGYEFSGVAKDGRRVMGLAESKAFSTHLSQDELLMIEIPEKWTLEEAATIPLVYITVYTAFFMTTYIEKGKSILIHAGSGGIGLAAIRVAFAYDLKVFTTVSTKEKKEYLLEEFPQLQAKNIGNTRDTSFEQMVMTETNGKGVDYVLNSLADDKMQASIRCLADNGFFLEVGKFDMLMRNKIHLNHFLRGITFKAVLFRVVDMLKNENQARVRK